MQEEMTWKNRGLNIFNEQVIVRKSSNNFKLYVNTQKMEATPERVEEIIEKMKKELKKINVKVGEEETLYSFKVITIEL